MLTWDRFYSKEQTLRDYLGSIFTHNELFAEIIKEKPKRILEVGVGTGITGIFLSHLGFDVTGIDNNEKVISSAKSLCGKLNGKVNYIFSDAFNIDNIFRPQEFDMVFSQGLFEHLNDRQICQLLQKLLKIARIVLISVPSKFYMKKDVGDERLMSREKWLNILRGFNFNIDFIKYYGFHLPLRESLYSFIFNPLLIGKFFLGSVLKERSHILIKVKN